MHFRNVPLWLTENDTFEICIRILSVLNHLKTKEFSVLPKPDGPLARPMPCSVTETANGTVCKILHAHGHLLTI